MSEMASDAAKREASNGRHGGEGTRLNDFERWLEKMGVTWNREGIEFVTRTNGFGVVAKRDVDAGETLARVPMDACLTAKNCCVAEQIARRKLGGGLALSVAIAAERARGKASKWHEYLNAMEMPDVPLRWKPEELEELTGTTIDGLASRDASHIREDYDNIFREVIPNIDQTHALEAVCLFSSRAFGASARRNDAETSDRNASLPDRIDRDEALSVGNADGCSLPLQNLNCDFKQQGKIAGAYSHPGLASSSQTADIRANSKCTDQGIYAEDGSLAEPENGMGRSLSDYDQVSYDEEESGSDSEDGGVEQEEAMVPIADMFNHRVAAVNPPPQYHVVMEGAGQFVREGTAGRERLPQLQIGILEEGDTLVIVALAPALLGSEIWNTYGELGNADLLNRYGFTASHNPFDTVCIHMEDLVHQVEERFGKRWCRRRTRLAARVLEDVDGSFDIYGDVSLEKNLHILLELLHVPEEVFATLEPTEESITALLEGGLGKESVDTLTKIAKSQLNCYPHSFQEDVELFETVKAGSRLHHALVLRMSEKRIWKQVLSYESLHGSQVKRRKLEIQGQ